MPKTLFLFVFVLAFPSLSIAEPQIVRSKVPNEYIVATNGSSAVSLKAFGVHGVIGGRDLTKQAQKMKMLKVVFSPVIQKSEQIVSELKKDPNVLWVAPNYKYEGDILDVVGGYKGETKDPRLSDQYHHVVMKNIDAWDTEMGSDKMIVAVLDTGLDVQHEDIKSNVYINKGEVPDNDKDDDGNGYIDDVTGWFVKGETTVREDSSYHGTHVAGIVAATADNDLGVAGTANGVKILPVQISPGFSSAVVAEAFHYAVDNGASIITMSFNIDRLSNDRAFLEAVKYAYDNGVIYFNSAGNSNQENPPRTKVEHVVLVCSTIADNERNDVKSRFSNYGSKIPICAPGGGGADREKGGILSLLPANRYGYASGTSMAAPNAAGVAALIWSQNPNWDRSQVLAQLFGTADNIDELNERYRGKLGTGRVNSDTALKFYPWPVRVRGLKEIKSGIGESGASELTLQFLGVVDPDSAYNTANYNLLFAGRDNQFGTLDDEEFETRVDFEVHDFSQEVILTTPELEWGRYRFVVKAGLQDPFGQELDGNSDGEGGDDYVTEFEVR